MAAQLSLSLSQLFVEEKFSKPIEWNVFDGNILPEDRRLFTFLQVNTDPVNQTRFELAVQTHIDKMYSYTWYRCQNNNNEPYPEFDILEVHMIGATVSLLRLIKDVDIFRAVIIDMFKKRGECFPNVIQYLFERECERRQAIKDQLTQMQIANASLIELYLYPYPTFFQPHNLYGKHD